MKINKPVEGPITTDFYDSRGTIEKPHIHGAIDIGAASGTIIRAPENGLVFAWCAYRPEDGLMWPTMPTIAEEPFTFRNYFYDTYGGCIVLITLDKRRTHIISHSFAKQLFENVYKDIPIHAFEEPSKKRFPLHAYYTEPFAALEGQLIGLVGDGGKSSGPHVHWEIHNGTKWNHYDSRINPEKVI